MTVLSDCECGVLTYWQHCKYKLHFSAAKFGTKIHKNAANKNTKREYTQFLLP